VLGSFDNSLGNTRSEATRSEAFNASPRSRAAARETKRQQQRLRQLLVREWSELPYAMMRLTAARRPWDSNRFYWRDQNVQLREIDLSLTKSRAQDDAPTYTATYAREDRRHDFALHPSLEDDRLRWSAPGICDTPNLTTDQLAEKLLAKLVAFYTTGLS